MQKREYTKDEMDRLYVIRDGLDALLDWCDSESMCCECPFHRTHLCEQTILSGNIEKLRDTTERVIYD